MITTINQRAFLSSGKNFGVMVEVEILHLDKGEGVCKLKVIDPPSRMGEIIETTTDKLVYPEKDNYNGNKLLSQCQGR